MRSRTTLTVRSLCSIVLVVSLLALAGCGGASTRTAMDVGTGGAAVSPSYDPGAAKSDVGGAPVADELAVSSTTEPSPTGDMLVITNAGIGIEVKNLEEAVESVRAIATKHGAQIANLSVYSGSETVVTPEPYPMASSGDYVAPTPGGASITLRVPSDKLPAAEREIGALGKVTSQTSSQDDVTQQHVDLKARLKNLEAEETRLRAFFTKATKVSEMLAIEQELARVRGDIESMRAQIDYLERQAALATLTVTLSQPGALVSPAAGGWGFAAAIRDGVRGGAAVTRGLITVLLAMLPLIVLGVLLFLAIRAMVRGRRRRHAAASADDYAAQEAALPAEHTDDSPQA
ncbi:MAG: DUF4349 domain-containing protein [Coriobacteriia bacterium]|nr:DUF4349 domain-containing protein [Coriobacteriia bacterium]